MKNNKTGAWSKAADNWRRLMKHSLLDYFEVQDLITDGIMTSAIPARGKIVVVNTLPYEPLSPKKNLDMSIGITDITKDLIKKFDTRKSEAPWSGMEHGILIVKALGRNNWFIFHDVELQTRLFDHYVREQLTWNSADNVGRPRAAAKWSDFLDVIMRLERASLLNQVSCSSRSELERWITEHSATPPDPKTIRHDVNMLWDRFVKGRIVSDPGSYDAFHRAEEDDFSR